MATYYTVVQYVPDAIADERVNLGAIVFGDGQIRSRFTREWKWVERFGPEDIAYLRELEHRVAEVSVNPTRPVPLQFLGRRRLTEQTLVRMIDESSGAIQFTPAQASLEEPQALLERLASSVLRERRATRRPLRHHAQAVRIAADTARRAIAQRLGPVVAHGLVKTPFVVPGGLIDDVKVDLGVANGKVFQVVEALSFEIEDMPKLTEQVQTTLYTLQDVRTADESLDMVILALPPREGMAHHRDATLQFEQAQVKAGQIGARLVAEVGIDTWAEDLADTVDREIGLLYRRRTG